MSDAFARASVVLFGNRDRTVLVTYTVAATGQVVDGIRVLRVQPTRTSAFLGGDIASGTTAFRARQSDIPPPAEGDLIRLASGESFAVQGIPVVDDLGVWWHLDTVPAEVAP